jgi:hypothetical protein
MTNDEPWYIVERSEQLAFIYLTRSKKLTVTHQSSAFPRLDFIVNIGGEDVRKTFEIEVKAVRKPSKKVKIMFTLNELLLIHQANHPVALFLFVMENDNGYFTWLSEPAVESENPRKLVSNIDVSGSADDIHRNERNVITYDISKMLPLNDETLEMIISQVDRWYDAT